MEKPVGALKIRSFKPADKKGLIALWMECNLVNPKNDPGKDIARKARVKTGGILVGVVGSDIAASAMYGYEGHRGWINYLAVRPDFQKHGFGRRIMERAERELERLGCPKINLQVRKGNKAVLEFYKKIGFVEDDVISMGRRLKDDSESKGKARRNAG